MAKCLEKTVLDLQSSTPSSASEVLLCLGCALHDFCKMAKFASFPLAEVQMAFWNVWCCHNVAVFDRSVSGDEGQVVDLAAHFDFIFHITNIE
eukprot:2283486-Amphidinium_carterae.1